MTEVITLYNNKGGVSKTTTIFNIGVYLASRLNKKVLFIDTDSQCNLTELFFASDPEYYKNLSSELPGDSILDIYKDRLEGAAQRINVDKIKFAESKLYKNAKLIRGDIEFNSRAEPYFSSSINQAITSNVNEKNTYISFRRLVKDLSTHHRFDYILIDLGPSTGAISRLAFLAADKFIIPVTPDRFSFLGITTLPKILESWIDQDKLILNTLPPYGIEDSYTAPEFCGVINQNFQAYKSQAKESYQKWSRKIRSEIKSRILGSEKIKISRKIEKGNDPFICSIEYIGQLAPVSQILGKAIFDLNQADSALASSNDVQFYGNVWELWRKKIETYEGEIKKIVEAII